MQATAGKYNNHINNRLGIAGIVLNLVEVSEHGKNVIYFDLSFPQADAEDGVLPCRADDPRIVSFSRCVSIGFTVEVGGELRQDSEGRFYVHCCYAQFVRKKGGSYAKPEAINATTGR
jgi:hypothetical protein